MELDRAVVLQHRVCQRSSRMQARTRCVEDVDRERSRIILPFEPKQTSCCCGHVSKENLSSTNTIPQISLFSLPFLPCVLEPLFEMGLISRDWVAPMVAILPARSYMLLKCHAVVGVDLDEERTASLYIAMLQEVRRDGIFIPAFHYRYKAEFAQYYPILISICERGAPIQICLFRPRTGGTSTMRCKCRFTSISKREVDSKRFDRLRDALPASPVCFGRVLHPTMRECPKPTMRECPKPQGPDGTDSHPYSSSELPFPSFINDFALKPYGVLNDLVMKPLSLFGGLYGRIRPPAFLIKILERSRPSLHYEKVLLFIGEIEIDCADRLGVDQDGAARIAIYYFCIVPVHHDV